MALTVKHLNGDASFFLSFEPILTSPTPGAINAEPFRILLDPWITGPSKIFHSRVSTSTHKKPACISSLQELPEPDLVIISQHKSDHCHEATLRQLPATGTKTIILAEPASARLIRSWKYFDKDKVRTIPKWESPKVTGRQGVVRIRVAPLVEGGEPGEVTAAFIPQRRDLSGLHGAIGITYRPPNLSSSPLLSTKKAISSRAATPILSPPATPKSHRSYAHLPRISSLSSTHDAAADLYPPTPTSPGMSSIRSERSAASLPLSVSSHLTNYTAATSATNRSTFPAPSSSMVRSVERPLSIIFSPHGISFPSLQSYTTGHLVAEAALPLTALLHCFDNVSNPWWLGGNILLGAPAGAETAGRLAARTWISAHDGDKEVRGIATGLLRTRKWHPDEVAGGLLAVSEEVANSRPGSRPGSAVGGDGGCGGGLTGSSGGDLPRGVAGSTTRTALRGKGTEVIALVTGEEVVLTSQGVWDVGRDREPGGAEDDGDGGCRGGEDDADTDANLDSPGRISNACGC
ncbi:hypothetical protein QBC33DRAFT_580211 [Phialemonium atrogriseum]|uniref:Uncharacterized protein n=1 Tax=Phialemonium atrogriseum TaxID=1093897 RepID=A0AAJ0BUQ7_9PEZI|nr:uncharacterized protein QBC33DRAFT_580211 [Phialemonium atrogriseum]KAK1764611.1 hypothetical protein QBC33DRAFT_580211 [Phialemonium atrogriseum]